MGCRSGTVLACTGARRPKRRRRTLVPAQKVDRPGLGGRHAQRRRDDRARNAGLRGARAVGARGRGRHFGLGPNWYARRIAVLGRPGPAERLRPVHARLVLVHLPYRAWPPAAGQGWAVTVTPMKASMNKTRNPT